MPLDNKVEAIKNMTSPTTQKGVLKFIDLVNYYSDMWGKHSHKLQNLTRLKTIQVKFK